MRQPSEAFEARPRSLRALILIAILGIILCAGAAHSQAIIIDHTCTDLSAIPDTALPNAISTKLVLRHASVGGNILNGLIDVYNIDHKYNRANWTFSGRGNPGWREKINDLVAYTAAHTNEYQVFTMKFCYVDQNADWPTYRDAMEQLESDYPDKKFIWWTIPIMTQSGSSAANTALRHAFNVNARNWCVAHGKILFDIADIECHDPAGEKYTDSNGNEVLYSAYTSDGGHINTTGRLPVAKAFWYMMARIGGWNPNAVTIDCPPGWLNAGWNYFSIPLTPIESSEGDDVLGFPCTNILYRWDPIGKTFQLCPNDFTTLERGRGYIVRLNGDATPSYLATQAIGDFEIAIPMPGWTWIGPPFDHPTEIEDCLIRNNATGEIRTPWQDREATGSWINWNLVWWDSGRDSWRLLTLGGPDDTMLHPWYGYLIWSNMGDLTLIVPAA